MNWICRGDELAGRLAGDAFTRRMREKGWAPKALAEGREPLPEGPIGDGTLLVEYVHWQGSKRDGQWVVHHELWDCDPTRAARSLASSLAYGFD